MQTSTDEMSESSPRQGSPIRGLLVGVGFAAAYFALQLWILPAMGVST